MKHTDTSNKKKLKVINKSTKKIRIFQIILFIIHIFLTTFTFQYVIVDGEYIGYTALDLVSFVGESGSTEALANVPKILGLISILFILIPTVALLTQVFDRFYNFKNVAGLICSLAGILMILNLDLSCIGGGAVVALLLYILTFFLSVMGLMARYLNIENVADKAPR